MRNTWIRHSGFDPFSEDDAFPQGSLGVTKKVFYRAPFSVAGVLNYDGGTRRGLARGQESWLRLHRISLGPEARYHLFPRLYFLARPALTLTHSTAALDESTAQTTLYSRAWLFGIDATVGANFEFARLKRSQLGFWIQAEGGIRLEFEHANATSPRR